MCLRAEVLFFQVVSRLSTRVVVSQSGFQASNRAADFRVPANTNIKLYSVVIDLGGYYCTHTFFFDQGPFYFGFITSNYKFQHKIPNKTKTGLRNLPIPIPD